MATAASVPLSVWGWLALQDEPLQEGRACAFSCQDAQVLDVLGV